jgi:predicted phage tail protein
MLTTVILDGPMGKAFGRKWELAVNSPKEALAMVNANKPGVFNWIRSNLKKYASYRVTCTYHDGKKEDLDSDTYKADRSLKEIRFTPVIEGASGTMKVVVGIVLLIVAYCLPWTASYTVPAGVSLIAGGIAQMLSPKKKDKEDGSTGSHYFNGVVNNTEQGIPVPLIYGRVLVGSQLISARLTVEETIIPTPDLGTGLIAWAARSQP